MPLMRGKETEMTAITQLREEIEKHPAGSATARLLSWAELQISDQLDRIYELEDDLVAANNRIAEIERMLP